RRQEGRERASLVLGALDANLAAEQSCDFPADGKPESRASILAVRRPISLLERLEDETLFLLGDSDSRIRDGECDYLRRCFERWILEATPLFSPADGKTDLAFLGELDGVGHQVLEDLQQSPAIRVNRVRQIGVHVDVEVEALLL